MGLILERLIERRKKQGLTQEALSGLVKISVPTIARMENGRSDPKTEELTRIAATLQTSVAYLLGETDDPSPPAQGRYNTFARSMTGEAAMEYTIAPADISRTVRDLGKMASGPESDGQAGIKFTPDGDTAPPSEDIHSPPASMPDWFPAIKSDPIKLASAMLLSEMDDDKARKVYDYLRDQKLIRDYQKEKGA
jgi:transcriptional regulator with XRE-family HTH domain